MQNQREILETVRMIEQQHLDIRTITMGISLYDCADADAKAACRRIYDKVTQKAERLVAVGEAIETEYGIPIVNKRVAVTPVAEVAAASAAVDYVPFARALERAAAALGINFIGGFSALVQKGMTEADRRLIACIPEALSETERVCASVNVASTRAGINMDAVAWMGRVIKATARRTQAQDGLGCAKLVVFANAVEDNPFMAGAFHGAGEPECCVNVGVSGPGVVKTALEQVKGEPFDVVANLPYYITTPVLFRLLESGLPVERICVMLQKEAVQRVMAQQGDKEYGPLAIQCAYRADIDRVMSVPPHSFIPQPHVDSEVIALDLRPYPVQVEERAFMKLVKSCFAMRRKTLVNNLMSYGLSRPQAQSAVEEAGLAPAVRAETLSLDDFLNLFEKIRSQTV